MTTDQAKNYLSLLEIRQKWGRKNVIITGGVFVVSLLLTLALGLIGELSGRSIYLVTGLDIAFGLGFLMTWVRLEIVRGSIDLVSNLRAL